MSEKYLLDVNALIALTESRHEHYEPMQKWFDSIGHSDWGICPLSEVGLVRVTTNPAAPSGQRTFEQVSQVLAELARRPGYRYWPIAHTWAELTAPFAARILGHQQVTDAYLLGLAIKEAGVLVTFDKGIKFLAGPEFAKNVLVLE